MADGVCGCVWVALSAKAKRFATMVAKKMGPANASHEKEPDVDGFDWGEFCHFSKLKATTTQPFGGWRVMCKVHGFRDEAVHGCFQLYN